MKKITKYFFKNSSIIHIFSLYILVQGIISLNNIVKEDFPKVSFNIININIVDLNKSPSVINNQITKEVEESLKSLTFIDFYESNISKSRSFTKVKLKSNTDIDKALNDIKNKIGQINFPSTTEEPIIDKVDTSKFPFISFAVFNKEKIPLIESKILDLKNVADVNISGFSDIQQIVIEIDLQKMNQYEVSPLEIYSSIINNNLQTSLGSIPVNSNEINLTIDSSIFSIEDIKNVYIRRNFSKKGVQIKDIASIKLRDNPDLVQNFVNTEKAYVFQVSKPNNIDVINLAKEVKQICKEQSKCVILDDSSYYVERRFKVLSSNAITGLLLVIGILILFFNTRIALLTAVGLPISFFSVFIVMDILGVSLNLISMFGLILVLGILVDDSIIVIEQYYQYREEGYDKEEAILLTIEKTLKTVSLTVVTTMCAFASIFFMGGIFGEFLYPVPIVVITALIASWIECFFILPNHIYHFGDSSKEIKSKIIKKKNESVETFLGLLQSIYKIMIRIAFKNYKLIVYSLIPLTLIFMYTLKFNRVELFPAEDIDRIIINVSLKESSSQKTSNGIALKLSKNMEKLFKDIKVNDKKILKNIRTYSGFKYGKQNQKAKKNEISFLIYLNDVLSNYNNLNSSQLIGKIKKHLEKELENQKELVSNINVEALKGGPPVGKDIDLKLYSNNLNNVIESSQEVLKNIKKEYFYKNKVISLESDFYEIDEYEVIFKDDEIVRLGFDKRIILRELQFLFSGIELAESFKGDIQRDIIIEVENNIDIKNILNIKILNPITRTYLDLNKLISIKKIKKQDNIIKRNGKYQISLLFTLNKELTSSREIKEELEKILKNYNNIAYSFEGENRDTQESFSNFLKAFSISIILILILLILLLNKIRYAFSIIILIPLSIIFVCNYYLIGDLIFGVFPISFMGLIGLIGLIGILVNDSIILVNDIKNKVNHEEIIELSKKRLRQIFLTSITTIFGLLPLLGANSDPFLKPMAYSLIFGLSVATILTLGITPILIYYFNRKNRLN